MINDDTFAIDDQVTQQINQDLILCSCGIFHQNLHRIQSENIYLLKTRHKFTLKTLNVLYQNSLEINYS